MLAENPTAAAGAENADEDEADEDGKKAIVVNAKAYDRLKSYRMRNI